MDKREINRKPRWSFCKSRMSEAEVTRVRAKDVNTGRFSPFFSQKGRQKERWKNEGRREERMFSRVCTSERACAMRWNRVKRKVKWSRPALGEGGCLYVYAKDTRASEEECYQGWGWRIKWFSVRASAILN